MSQLSMNIICQLDEGDVLSKDAFQLATRLWLLTLTVLMVGGL